jgi:hypothetical protein
MNDSFSARGTHGAPFGPGGVQRKQVVVAATAGVLALGVVAFVMIFVGGANGASGSILEANAAAKSSAAASPSGLYAYSIPAAYAGTVGHDPFKPLVVAKSAPASGGAGGGNSTGSNTSTSPSPTKTPTPTPTVIVPTITPTPTVTITPTPTATATVTVTPSPTGLPTSSAAQTLTLVSVDTVANTVNVTVTANGTTTALTVHNGAVFGTYFKVVSILSDPGPPPANGADFQYGDEFIQLSQGQSAQVGG